MTTFRHTLGEINGRNVDAIVLPGDLFHSRDLRPKTLDRVETALSERVPEDVPVLVSRGNHDENLSPREVTWLNYLHRRGHIVLLEADLDGAPETPAGFSQFDSDNRGEHAGFVDLPTDEANGPVRVFGLQWRGARTPDALEAAASGIEQVNQEYGTPAYTVLLGHFGMEDEVPTLGGTITHADLRGVREVVDYFALGHIHKRYESAGWLYNPGSPEAHTTREGRDDWEHGYYTVDLEPEENASGPGVLAHDPTHYPSKRRAYHPIEFDVTPHDSPGDLETAFREHVRDQHDAIEARCARDIHAMSDGSRRPPLVDLRFTGSLQFSRSDLRTGELAEWTETECDALYVQTTVGVRTVDVQALLSDLDGEEMFVGGKLNTEALEREVFETIAAESEYGDHAEGVADVLERAHAMSRRNEDTEDVVSHLGESRRELFPGMTEDVTVEVSEDPFGGEDGSSDGEERAGEAPTREPTDEHHPDATAAGSRTDGSTTQEGGADAQLGEFTGSSGGGEVE